MRTLRTAAATAVLTLATVGVIGAPAQAGSGDVVKRGSCTGSADWKLKVGPEDGRLEVEGEVDSNRVGQRWTWSLSQDGVMKASGASTTAGASGSFSVRRLLANTAGTDTIVFRAVRSATGESCRGVVIF